MNDGGAERVLRGVPASGGLAVGPVLIPTAAAASRRSGRPEEEAAALRRAIDAAGKALRRLMAAEDRLAAQILEFQAMLLEDEELTGPVFARIEAGEPADSAWRAALDAKIADYAGSGDPYPRSLLGEKESGTEGACLHRLPRRPFRHRTALGTTTGRWLAGCGAHSLSPRVPAPCSGSRPHRRPQARFAGR